VVVDLPIPTLLSTFSSAFFLSIAPATPEIYTLSLHDALPILHRRVRSNAQRQRDHCRCGKSRVFDEQTQAESKVARHMIHKAQRSEEHTSELQSRFDLVCRLLLEKKKKTNRNTKIHRHQFQPS